MKIDFTRQDGLTARMTIVLEHADYGPVVEKNTKDYQKKINMKGFRAGKTPKTVMQKMYGKGILEETISKLLNEKLFGYLDEQKIGYFGSPILDNEAEPQDFNPKEPRAYSFTFELGLKPDFELQYNAAQPLTVAVPSIDQAGLDEDVVRYRRLFGEAETITDGSIEMNDRVGVSLQRVDADGNVHEDKKETIVDLERVQGSAKTELIGKKIGDSLTTELDSFIGQDRQVILKNTLGLEEDPAPDQPLMYKVTIDSFKRPQSTPLTGEQISKFVGRQMEDEAAFRKMLEEREEQNNQTRVNDIKKMTIRKNLLDANPFDVPEEFLINWLNHQRDQKVKAGTRQANNFIRDTKWSLLLQKIQEEKNLEVTEKDVQKQVTNWVVQNVNYNQIDIRKYLDKLYSNEYFMSSMRENAMEEVVFRTLLPEYQFAENPVSEKEFEKAYHDIHHELFDHDHEHEPHDHDHDHDHDHGHSHTHHEHSHG